jgi:hypothetical protein
MGELGQGWLPLAVGGLLYAGVWAFWRCFLAYSFECDPVAEERADALLADLLSMDERRQLAESGYLTLPSPGVAGRTYRIPAQPGWVDVFQGGRLAMRLCALPIERLPAADIVLMHKLMIEGNEQEYLRQANVRVVR